MFFDDLDFEDFYIISGAIGSFKEEEEERIIIEKEQEVDEEIYEDDYEDLIP